MAILLADGLMVSASRNRIVSSTHIDGEAVAGLDNLATQLSHAHPRVIVPVIDR